MGIFHKNQPRSRAAAATLERSSGAGSAMKYPALAGQYLGIIETGTGRRTVSAAVVRTGLDVVQLPPRMHPLLASLGGGARSSANIFYPEAVSDLDELADRGLLVDLEDTARLDTAGLRLRASGTGAGINPDKTGYTILGTVPVTVPAPVFWAWSFTDSCSSILETCLFVARVHPDIGISRVAAELKSCLADLHRAGAVTVDATAPRNRDEP